MTKKLTNQPSEAQLLTTEKAYKLRELSKNDDELAEELGMAKVTLYTRFRESNWKKGDINLINNIYELKIS